MIYNYTIESIAKSHLKLKLRMAKRIHHPAAVWIIPFIVAIFIQQASCHDTNTNENVLTHQQYVTLRNCCNHNADNFSYGNCSNTIFKISWKELQAFGIPIQNVSQAQPVFSNDGFKFKNVLDCHKQMQFLVPMRHAQKEDYPKGLHAFFSQDGHFQFGEEIYSPESFCIHRITSQEILMQACNQTALCEDNNNLRPCIFRCCNYGEVWDTSTPRLHCANSGQHKWKPKLHFSSSINSNEVYTPKDDPIVFSTHPRSLMKHDKHCENYTFESPRPSLHNSDARKRFGKRPFKILKNGSVLMKLRKREWVMLAPGEYCVDGFQHGEGNYSGDSEDSLLFECKQFETQADLEGKALQRAYSLSFGIILVICLCFLLMTTIVYILLWSKHNIHGWTVFSYIVALLLTYLMLGVSHFASITLVRKGNDGSGIWTFCGLTGILCHFTFLSTFSWSTVLNYDLWCTFKCLKPTNGRSSGLKKFIIYCIFAFTVPFLIVTVGIALDVLYRDDVYNDLIITPEYGRIVCYVEPRYARFLFIIVPIAILLGINLLFFGNTAYSVYKLKQSIQFATSSSTRKETKYQTFRLIIKLLMVNGILWIVDILSWYFQKNFEEVGTLSFVLNIFNVMQAIAIFFLFVFKDDILDALRKKYPCLKGTVNLAFKLKNFTWNPIRYRGQSRESPPTSLETYNTKINDVALGSNR